MNRSALFAIALLVFCPGVVLAQSRTAAPDEKTVADAYVYLLGRMLVIRQEHIDRKGPGFAYNKVKYNPLGSADFVNPNFDVAYLEAWFAVDDKTPVILEVPEVKGRYYTAQILDEWGEVIVNINERSFPSKPFGKFMLVKPGSSVRIPEGMGRIELHSGKAKMLGRVELKDDPDGAVRLQKQFKVTVAGKPAVKAPPPIPMFDNKELIGVEIFDQVDVRLASALDVSPAAAEMQQKVRAVAAYAASGKEARAAVDKLLRGKLIREFQEYADQLSAQQLVDRGARFLARCRVRGDCAHLLLHFRGGRGNVERAGEANIDLIEDLDADQFLVVEHRDGRRRLHRRLARYRHLELLLQAHGAVGIVLQFHPAQHLRFA